MKSPIKPKGRHPDKALSSVRIKNIAEPGRYADGNGLYLVVDPSGAKRWILRIVIQRKRRDIGLGGLSVVSLAEARDQAREFRAVARAGGNPLADRNRSRQLPKFAEVARIVYEQRKHAWKNSKHQAQWLKSLEIHVFPEVGDMRVDQVGTSDVLRVLSPIWTKTPETARRNKQRIGMIFDWAKAAGYREGDNPIDGLSNALVKQKNEGRHFAAMPYVDVPVFVQKMRTFNAAMAAKLAFEFLILTAARTSEVLQAEFAEIDLKQAVWTVPAARMKANKVHRVPLVPRCVEILTQVRSMFPDAAVLFPGRSDRLPLSNMAFLMMLRREGYEVTAHGFRSAFRDWAAECTNFPREVCEMALAHTVQNKVEAAYRRGDLLDKRRDLMIAWSDYISNKNGRP
jgi:integrase